jgi:peptidoglycan/xylan/chitin deacetylase (PgdA/CDA1 family)
MTRLLFSHRIARATLIGVALLVGCLLRTAPAGATTFQPMTSTPGQTVVSLEFDDGSADQYQLGPMLASHNMRATFFINSGLEINSYHMTWSQIHDLYSQGNEIGGHTVLHSDLATQSSDEAAREICNDRATLLNEGFPVTDFAYPYGSFNDTTISQVQQCGYESARTVSGILSPNCETSSSCPYAESIPPANPYLTRTPQNILTTDTLAEIEGYVTQAQQHGGGWVQLVLHHICDSGCGPYAITQSNLAAFLDWLSIQQNTTTATVQDVLGGTVQPAVPGPAPVNLPGPNLINNPSLESEVNSGAEGYENNSYGNNAATFTQTTDAHSGQVADRVQLSNYSSGEAWLGSKMDLGRYAPTPTVGDNYDLNAYYKSSAPALFTIYTRNAKGEWTWWLNSGFYAASSSWTKATYTTPPVPAGVTGISIGLGIQAAGSLTIDDYGLVDRGVIPPAANTLANPNLESLGSGGIPVCWAAGSSAGLTGTWSNTTDSHGGANAELANVSAYSSGDMKLVSQQDATLPNPTLSSATLASGGSLANASYYYKITATTAYGQTLPSNELSASTSTESASVVLKWPAITSGSVTGYKIYRASASGGETLLASVPSTATSYTDNGSATPGGAAPPASNTASKVSPCAPTATPGDTYQGSAWYKSSAGASVRLVVYYRDATGNWVFWKTQPVAASTSWTQATVNTDPVPPRATALSFGVSLFSAGTLYVDDLSLGDLTLASASDPPPCGSDVCDTTPPSSSASSPASSTTGSFSVSYAAADEPSGSGLAHVDLYVKGPSDFGYTLVSSNPGYATSGLFGFAALEGDGAYSFYTVATDAAGNSETAPLSSQTMTVLDSTAPTSTASAPALTKSPSVTVAYTAADAISGIAQVDLYAQAPGQSGYAKVASDTSGSASGSFTFVPSAGNGTYDFYTLATDKAGNVQAAPASPDASTLLDTAGPSSSASSPAYSASQSFSVSYSAADGPGGSGLARVDLYAQAPGHSGYTLVASDTSGSASGSFAYTAAKESGAIGFYTIATDQAGNVQATPSSPNSTTLLDAVGPSSTASAPGALTYGSIPVSYTAADNNGGSGLASVDLYARAPGQSDYTLVASDTSGSASGSFTFVPSAGNGTYDFYTLATDRAGNAQTAPASPDASTSYMLDTAVPSSKASSPANSYASSFTVTYTAADNSGGSGPASVDLYAQAPGQSGYTLVASDTSASGSGGFTFVATAGDGTYNFYTVATDKAGNVQAAPASPDASTNVKVDATSPSSNASSPTSSASQSFSVSYSAADDPGGSGLGRVDLYAKAPGQSSYAKVASDTSGASSGSFSYTAAAGDGNYSFYAIATDNVGNTQATPASADATTLLDTTPPSANASAPASVAYGTIPVSYVAADKAGGSGLARVDLYAKVPGQPGYAKVASDTSGAGSGGISYTPAAGNGTYSFYAIATDKLGNVQATPAAADASTSYTLDVTAPTSTATAPAYANATTWTVSYAGSDNNGGSGLASVELWARVPGAKTYVKAATNATGAASGTFTYTGSAGEGSYAFYTIAVDKAGNRQAAPKAPTATTMLDTVAPGAFQINAPGQYLRASVKLSLSNAPADGGSGVASVIYQYRAGGSASAWSAACTATASPWGCSWNTATAATPDGPYELRAVAADRAGNSTLASNTPLTGLTIANTPPTAKSISTTNVSGGTVGRAESGDSMTFTYSATMGPGSILEAWSGAATAVQVKFVAKNTKDTTLAVWNSAGNAQLALANPLDLGAAYVPKEGAIFKATMVQNGAAITVTLGPVASGSVTAAAIGGTVTWTPSNKATDLAGNKCSTTSVSALGPAF